MRAHLLDTLRFYASTYTRLIGVQLRSQMQYPLAFLLDAAGAAIATGSFFVSLTLILQRFGNLGGWRLGEVALLFGMLEFSFGMMDMIFTGYDPRNFGENVRRGAFDQLLLRPLPPMLQVLGSRFLLRRLGRIIQGSVIFAIALSLVDISWTPAKLAYLPCVLFGMVAFFGGLFIIGATISFWTIESIEVVNIFTYGASEMISYPMHIYPAWLRSIFTYILPAALLNYYPALYFLGKADPTGAPDFMRFLSPLAGLAVLGAAYAFWRFGVRHYQSTGT